MLEKGKENIILMAIFAVTKSDILDCTNEMGIPEEVITREVVESVREKVGQSLRKWREVIKDVVREAITQEVVKCPLGLVCSPQCAWREAGECVTKRS